MKPVPLLSSNETKIAIRGDSRQFIDRVAELRGEALPAKLTEALDYFDLLAERDDLSIHFMLEPGEIPLWHNFQMPHARDAYRDSPNHVRHLLRLWLKIGNDQPIAAEILERANNHERVYRERRGRIPA